MVLNNMAHIAGGTILPSEIREYGRANLNSVDKESKLMKDITIGSQVWMSHGGYYLNMPSNF